MENIDKKQDITFHVKEIFGKLIVFDDISEPFLKNRKTLFQTFRENLKFLFKIIQKDFEKILINPQSEKICFICFSGLDVSNSFETKDNKTIFGNENPTNKPLDDVLSYFIDFVNSMTRGSLDLIYENQRDYPNNFDLFIEKMIHLGIGVRIYIAGCPLKLVFLVYLHDYCLISDIEHISNKIESNKDSNCAICLNSKNEKDWIKLKNCIHEYHLSCFNEWIKYGQECPYCRSQF